MFEHKKSRSKLETAKSQVLTVAFFKGLQRNDTIKEFPLTFLFMNFSNTNVILIF